MIKIEKQEIRKVEVKTIHRDLSVPSLTIWFRVEFIAELPNIPLQQTAKQSKQNKYKLEYKFQLYLHILKLLILKHYNSISS